MDTAGVALVLIGPGSVDQVCITSKSLFKRLLRIIFAFVSIGVPTS